LSWFEYGEPEKRSWRKGVWLRVRALDAEILEIAKRFMRPDEEIQWVEIKEMQSDGRVLLEVWANNYADKIEHSEKEGAYPKYFESLYGFSSRYNVFYFSVKEDPKWVCEGDLGRGMVETRRKDRLSRSYPRHPDARMPK
jgi:hypothetical protein